MFLKQALQILLLSWIKLVFIPPYSGRLAGVMENVLNILSEWGYSVKEENIPVESLYDYDGVYLTNALI